MMIHKYSLKFLSQFRTVHWQILRVRPGSAPAECVSNHPTSRCNMASKYLRISVFLCAFFGGKPFTLSNTLTITNHKPWKQKPASGIFRKPPKPAPPRDPNRIRVARVASWPLDALQTRKNQSLASLQRPTHQHQSWAKFVDSCLRVSCSFL